MTDKHLNLFYSYNKDNQLIEDNLTRAFILTLSLLSASARQAFLSNLFAHHQNSHYSVSSLDIDFSRAEFALQGNIDESIPLHADVKVLLTIATEPIDDSEDEELGRYELEEVSDDPLKRSRPDAWIYDPEKDFCILIESKSGSYPLYRNQLSAHCQDWFGVNYQDLIDQKMYFSRTWIDILEVIDHVEHQLPSLNPSDKKILDHFSQFLYFFGYKIFRGIEIKALDHIPDLVWSFISDRNFISRSMDISRLSDISLDYSFFRK